MKISRRNFLGALSASVAAVVPFAGSALGTGSVPGLGRLRMSADALSELGWSSFYPYINTEFQFEGLRKQDRLGAARLTLTGMSAIGTSGKTSRGREPKSFVLTFKAPTGDNSAPRMLQDTYSVEHFALGNFDLFISDGNVVNGECIYTAVINRATE